MKPAIIFLLAVAMGAMITSIYRDVLANTELRRIDARQKLIVLAFAIGFGLVAVGLL